LLLRLVVERGLTEGTEAVGASSVTAAAVHDGIGDCLRSWKRVRPFAYDVVSWLSRPRTGSGRHDLQREVGEGSHLIIG
jgi:hypothetical protein